LGLPVAINGSIYHGIADHRAFAATLNLYIELGKSEESTKPLPPGTSLTIGGMLPVSQTSQQGADSPWLNKFVRSQQS
jgi:hypothetical protein